MSTSAKLVLADGTIYAGTTYAATGSVFGQLVFDTTMTGYQHSLTNPSNAATIMVFTFPHIGNVGVNAAMPNQNTTGPVASSFALQPASDRIGRPNVTSTRS